MSETQDKARLLHLDQRQYILENAGTEAWLTVYLNHTAGNDTLTYFCALIPTSRATQCLSDVSWDLQMGDGRPGIVSHHNDSERVDRYYRYGDAEGVEPLILKREFHGIRPASFEISEEFRLFHNLYHDALRNTYIYIDDNGDENDAIICDTDSVKIQLSKVKEYIQAKGMLLALFVVSTRWSAASLKQLDISEPNETIQHNNVHLSLVVGESMPGIDDDNKKTYARLLGKKLISAETNVAPNRKSGPYVEFIIGIDENGNPVRHTCEPGRLGNSFGANADAPDYLTPVFFRREVLNKYYSNTGKYSVEDGSIMCGGLWNLSIDNNHERFVVVFLGDLGRDLRPVERLYWQSFNVPPQGKISDVNRRRNFDAEFAEPTKLDLSFKSKLEEFQEHWTQKYGWPLFKPLTAEDAHYHKSLHVPLTNDRSEFDDQVLALAKILVDSLNESKIQDLLSSKLDNGKGISKFERLLNEQGVVGFEPHITFLRNLYKLRHGAGHRKGDEYKKIAAVYRLDERELMTVYEEILQQAVDMLRFLVGSTTPNHIDAV
jgi:hypothetical protein